MYRIIKYTQKTEVKIEKVRDFYSKYKMLQIINTEIPMRIYSHQYKKLRNLLYYYKFYSHPVIV